MTELTTILTTYGNYILLGNVALSLLLFIMLIVTISKLGNMKRKYNRFMKGENGESLENAIMKKMDQFSRLESDTRENKENIDFLNKKINQTYQKTGIVKYDAFNEMGGQLSFVLALLDNDNNGVVFNSMHGREGCYNYIKEIVKGESYIVLGEEEKKALEIAKNARS